MSKLFTVQKFYDIAVCAAMVLSLGALIAYPSESVSAARDGLSLCARVVVPSLFPFFVLSGLIIETGLSRYPGRLLEPVMRPLFNVGGECSAAFVLGFIGGYPVGARTAAALYEKGRCSKAEAERLLSFCNNSGPAFILGVVGAGVFSSGRIGLLLYLAHVAASVCVGIVFRGYGRQQRSACVCRSLAERRPAYGFTAAFTQSVRSSVSAMTSICGFVVFFAVVIRLLFLAGVIPALASFLGNILEPFGGSAKWAESLLIGLIEISSGVWSLKEISGQLAGNIAMAAFMLGWAGLSVHCQVLSFIGGSGLSVKTYITGKLLHGVLSAAFTYAAARLFRLKAPVASYLAAQVEGIAGMEFHSALLLSSACALALLLALITGAILTGQKDVAKKKGKMYN